MFKIIYLEDDINLSNTISEFLEEYSFDVTTVYTAKDTLDELYGDNFDLLILDINLPDMNGFDLLKQLREANINIPVIVTTTLDDINSVDIGYSLGADDYLRKPFALKELLHRINVIIKRELNTRCSEIVLPNNTKFNVISNILTKDGTTVKLNQKELKLLKLFIQYKNEMVPLSVIYDNLWSMSQEISTTSVRTYIKNLRNIFGKTVIINIKKQGYKFVF